MIQLHVEPRVSKSWDAFRSQNPSHSIALDGYVTAGPRFDPSGPYANFDHHADVDRLATRSSCMQVYMAITLGLLDLFRKDDEVHAHIWVNDPDQDTSLAIWQLRNPEYLADISIRMPLARLLITEDLLDCTGGAYPVDPMRESMQEQAWVFEPYFEARTAGRLHAMDASAMAELIDVLGERITAHVEGRGGKVVLDTRYETIGGGPGWKMIVEHGPHARTELFGAGVHAFVSVRENDDGTWTYSIGRMSPFVPFDILRLYEVLNAAEGLDAASGWGGSDTIGGSPREGGSRLSPKQVEELVTGHVQAAV
jgi:hypothetical protein